MGELNTLPIKREPASSAAAWAITLRNILKHTVELNDITAAQYIIISYTGHNILKSSCHVIFYVNNKSEIGLIVDF